MNDTGLSVSGRPLLYVLDDGTQWCKIGLAVHPEGRRRDLQTGNPRLLRFVYVSRPGCAFWNERREREVHDRLASLGVPRQGEWFMVDHRTIREAIAAVASAAHWDHLYDHVYEDWEVGEDVAA